MGCVCKKEKPRSCDGHERAKTGYMGNAESAECQHIV